jgi:hypothetical protein
VFECCNIVSEEDLRQATPKTQEYRRGLPEKQNVAQFPTAAEGGAR